MSAQDRDETRARRLGTPLAGRGAPETAAEPTWQPDADDRPEGGPRTGARRTVMGAIRELPHYVRLLWGLARDPRVEIVDKLLVVAAAVYIVSPIDIIPDFIPFLGQVDDLYLLILALQRMMSRAGRAVLRDHWTGKASSLNGLNLAATLAAAAFFLPPSIRKRVRRTLRG
ncbi:MAG TPA: YkvA family protein [Gemmatimonadaceae bacterium]|nr:YkvA family protein [Gemmatimonadaceae bacterium]